MPETQLCKLSVARCARVSYLTHDGKRDHAKDLELYERLLGGGANGHWSPFEHVATPAADPQQHSANFAGWEQYRKRFPQEHAGDVPRRIRRCDLRSRSSRCCWRSWCRRSPARSRARTSTSRRSPRTRCLHGSAVSLVDPVRQRRARAIADYQDVTLRRLGRRADPRVSRGCGNRATRRACAISLRRLSARAVAAARSVRCRLGRDRNARIAAVRLRFVSRRAQRRTDGADDPELVSATNCCA